MKLARFFLAGKPVIAVAATGSSDFAPLSGVTTIAAALAPERRSTLEQAASSGTKIGPGATLLTSIDPGVRLFCIGVNYRSHAGETGREIPAVPSLFTRTHESVVPHGTGMERPTVSDNFDFEGELGVVIAKPGRYIKQDAALSCVGGYTCFNDGSIRDYQKRSTTDLLIHTIPRIIEYISEITSLLPGDVIATGTPAGVGSRRTPPLWMKPGDTIEVEITGVGTLSNPIVQGSPA